VAACARGDITRVGQLLDARHSVNDKNAAGQTPLLAATANGHRSLALTLIVLGADLTAQDTNGMNAVMHAVEKRDHAFIQMMKQFWQVSYEQDAAKRREAFGALPGVDRTLLKRHDFDLVQFSAWNEATEQVNSRGETPVLLAARLGHWEMFQDLAITTSGIKSRDHDGRNAAMWFAANGTVEPFQRLEQHLIGKAGAENGFVGEMLAFDVEQLALVDRKGNNALSLARTSSNDARVADILTRHLETLIANETLTIDRITRGGMSDEELVRLLQYELDNGGTVAERKQQLLDNLLQRHTERRRLAVRALGVSAE
jgi:ankyrin repeat protein